MGREGGRQVKGRAAAAFSWAGDHRSDAGSGAREGPPLRSTLSVNCNPKKSDAWTTAGSESMATASLHLQRVGKSNGALVRDIQYNTYTFTSISMHTRKYERRSTREDKGNQAEQ